MSAAPKFYNGFLGLTANNSEYNKYEFLVKQMLGRVNTMAIVQVTGVKGGGGALAQAGTVNVQPLTNQTNGLGVSSPHAVVFNLSYIRVQGGSNAIIMDPAVGDIGIAIIADRDTSSVRANRGQANPGSYRRFNLADGVYLGGILNGVPSQYVQFTPDGLNMVDMNGNKLAMSATGVALTTPRFTVNGVVVGG